MMHATTPAPRRAAIPAAGLALLVLAGCSTGHVGESWQCPLAEGGTCDSVAAADPAVPDPKAAGTAVLAAPLWGARGEERPGTPPVREPAPDAVRGPGQAVETPCVTACRERFGPFAWLARLFDGGDDDGEGPARPAAGEPGAATADAAQEAAGSPTPPAGTEPRSADPDAALHPAEPGAARDNPQAGALRTGEVVARIWIAPFVDADGVYREAAWVRAVLAPAGWRLP